MVQPRKICPDMTEKIVDWDLKNWNKQTALLQLLGAYGYTVPFAQNLKAWALLKMNLLQNETWYFFCNIDRLAIVQTVEIIVFFF